MNLDERIAKHADKVRTSLRQSLDKKRRAVDVQRAFIASVKNNHPGVTVVWLAKDNTLARILIKNYDTDTLMDMMQYAVAHKEEYFPKGFQFTYFYYKHAELAQKIADKNISERRIEEIKEKDNKEITEEERKEAMSSPIFDKLPKIFRDSLLKKG